MTQILQIKDKENPRAAIPVTIGVDVNRTGVEILVEDKLDWLAPDDAIALARALRLEAGTLIKIKTPVTRWLEECCQQSGTFTPVGDLYQSWSDWCGANDEDPGSLSGFGRRLTRMFSKKRMASGWLYAVALQGNDQ